MSKDIQCPYCEQWLEINHDDGFGYAEGVKHEQECGHCGKYFVFETSVIFCYEAEQADCLNDGEHQYKPSFTFPVERTQMQCTSCDHRRACTTDELQLVMEERLKCPTTDTAPNGSEHENGH